MHDSQMHAPDLRRVIIDQSHRALGKSPAKPKLLADFALNRVVVGRLVQMQALVGIVDVPADADRGFGDEPLLAGLRATRVVQDFSPVQEDRIRDDLFQRGIVLRRRSRCEKIILLQHKLREVVIDRRAEALKAPQLVEKTPLHH